MSGVDEKWLAEQSIAASTELIGRYGWWVSPDDPEMDQEGAVRLLTAVGWSEGYKAGLRARHDG